MEPQADKSPQALAWTAAILLIVFCGAGVAAMMGWIPISFGTGVPVITKLERPVAGTPAAVAARCTECGVVKSVRKVAARRKGPAPAVAGIDSEAPTESASSYEVTVHLDDGGNRVITEAGTPSWRFGDKVRIVDGVIQPNVQSPA